MFEEIKKNSPKAWRKFRDWAHKKHHFLPEMFNDESLVGYLFTFFDEQGIWILRTIRSTNTERGNFPVYYMYNTSFADESFEIVITKAFEILESK